MAPFNIARYDCRAILSFLQREPDENRRRFLLADLLTKIDELPKSEISTWRAEAYRAFSGVGQPSENDKILMKSQRTAVGCLVIKPRELRGVLGYFGISPRDDEASRQIQGFPVWEVETPDYDVRILLVGEERGHNVGPSVAALTTTYEIDLMALCGVAAGVQGAVNLFDVVVAERVMNFEGAVVAPDKVMPRPEWIELPEIATRELAYFQVRTDGRIQGFEATQTALIDLGVALDGIPPDIHPRLLGGTIASGEKMIFDGSFLARMRETIDERIRALDQESWAFAREASLVPVDWMIFRGVSDFATHESADPDSTPGGGGRAARQATGAAAAAAALDVFAQKILRKSS